MPTRRGGDLCKLLEIGGPDRGLRPHCGTHVFALLGNLSIVQINPFTLSPSSLQLAVSLSDLVWIFLACPPLLGTRKIFFTLTRTRFRRFW